MLVIDYFKRLGNGELIKDFVTGGINIFLIILSLNLLSINLAILDSSFMVICTIYVLIALIIFNLRFKNIYRLFKTKLHRQKKSYYKLLTGIILILLSFFLLLYAKSQMLWLISIPIFISGLDLILQSIELKRKELYLLSITSFVYTLFFMVLQTVPFLGYTIKQFSLFFSDLIGFSLGKSMIFGPSISGLWIVIIFVIFSLVILFLSEANKHYFVVSLIGLAVCWILYLFILGLIEFETKNDFLNLHYILFLICFIPVFIFLAKTRLKISNLKMPRFRNFKSGNIVKNLMVWALVLFFISSVLLTIFIYSDPTFTDKPKSKVLFYGQNQLGSWDVPEYGKYDQLASGMFGLLPYYLKNLGYENKILVENETEFLNRNQPIDVNITRYVNLTDFLDIIESENLTLEILEDVDILVVINLNTSFSDQEHDIIWDFIENGGSLLVLGDHTDIDGIQDPLNNLTKPFGISYRFDSAIPINKQQSWIPCYHLMHHPASFKIEDPDEIDISVGASLNIEWYVNPIISGRYALSDAGNRSKPEDAYLGDYEYNSGELIGDIILAGSAYYGDGKVIVFGDTSSFQNPSISYSYKFIDSIFSWLSSDRTSAVENMQFGTALVLLIVAFILCIISKKKISFVFFPLVICFALIISSVVNPMIVGETTLSEGNYVFIDASHGERFNIEPYNDESLSGFMLNLMRNDYFSFILKDFSKNQIKNSELLIFVAPTKTFSQDEVDFIKQYIRDGGYVILSTGYEDKTASMPLLEEFGLDIYDIPLGPIPYVEEDPEKYQKEPRFVDSWPIYIPENREDLNFTKFYNITILGQEYILMTLVRYKESIENGAGGLLLIADSQFLMDKNIEELYDYWPGNIQFLKNIIDALKETEVGE